ncbi:MAG: phosphodiester glycosidase family protein [Candidatus Gastranaerophilales bacterium]|nr:phosphodiester glycosidase family protein [Candidatus Gastranaerophilales bacterium]
MIKNILGIALVLIFYQILPGYTADDAINFYSPREGVFIVALDTQKANFTIKPYLSANLEKVEDVAIKNNAKVAINAGFFDPKSAETISFVTIDGQVVADPYTNKSLMANENAKPYITQILNRTEFRILKNEAGEINYQISPHNEEIPFGYTIIQSVQAGPLLVPQLGQTNEAFVIKKDGKLIRHAASALQKRPRSGIGIKNGIIYLILVNTEAAMTFQGFSNFMKNELKLESAMAFDGGTSSSLYINLPDKSINKTINGHESVVRPVKSILLIY